METIVTTLFALFACAGAQWVSSTWGSGGGYTNQMGMGPMGGYGHMPMHHWRDSGVDGAVAYTTKVDGAVPLQIIRSKMPSRVGLQDYSLVHVNAPDHDDITDHLIYRQSVVDAKRPVMGVLSLLTPPMAMAMAKQPTPSYQDQNDMMTCIGLDEPTKVHSTEPKIIISRGMPYYMQTMHKIKA